MWKWATFGWIMNWLIDIIENLDKCVYATKLIIGIVSRERWCRFGALQIDDRFHSNVKMLDSNPISSGMVFCSLFVIGGGGGKSGYHPIKAVPKTAVPKTAVNWPIIKFGGFKGFFYWRPFQRPFWEAAFLARNRKSVSLRLVLDIRTLMMRNE